MTEYKWTPVSRINRAMDFAFRNRGTILGVTGLVAGVLISRKLYSGYAASRYPMSSGTWRMEITKDALQKMITDPTYKVKSGETPFGRIEIAQITPETLEQLANL